MSLLSTCDGSMPWGPFLPSTQKTELDIPSCACAWSSHYIKGVRRLTLSTLEHCRAWAFELNGQCQERRSFKVALAMIQATSRNLSYQRKESLKVAISLIQAASHDFFCYLSQHRIRIKSQFDEAARPIPKTPTCQLCHNMRAFI